MTKVSTRITIALIAVLSLASCANTIRGVGKDADSTKNAVEDTVN